MKPSVLGTFVIYTAPTVVAQYTNQSAPFNLIFLSSNHTINGSSLGACHEGAAIEGPCLGPPHSAAGASYQQFQFNTFNTPYTGSKTKDTGAYVLNKGKGGVN